MVRVTYPDGEATVDATKVLLTNGQDYLLLGSPNTSNYDGYYVKLDEYYKVLWNILPTGSLEHVAGTVREFSDARQELFLEERGVIADCEGEFTLTLDCKRSHDESDTGRHYHVQIVSPHIPEANPHTLATTSLAHVTYTKQDAYTIHACIATTMNLEQRDVWRPVPYTYDDRRHSGSTRWVYDALALSGKGRVTVGVGTNKKEAEQKAFQLLLQRPAKKEKQFSGDMALAWRALEQLRTPTGIMAGLPWFYKEWSRDELIASGGLLAHDYADVIPILDKWYSTVRNDGSLPAIYPDEGLASADAPGWLGKRTLDVLAAAKAAAEPLHQDMLIRWRNAAERILKSVKSRLRDGLVWNYLNETWMDTSWHDDGRAGARIEIQALTLALAEAHAELCELTGGVHDNSTAFAIVQAVHERFVDGDVLLDGLHADGTPDHAIRPNIFLAWHAAPQLFLPEQWARFFANALSELWLSWGGLSSLSRADSRYHAWDSGEDSRAYHRGDSWYFVNNMAAIAMHAVDPERFSEHVRAIRDASVHDMKHLGIIGACSEISSAEQQEPMGCHAQAWSASTLVELLLMLR